MSAIQGKYGKTFGAIPLDNGGVRFSVWSPKSQKVELALFGKVKNFSDLTNLLSRTQNKSQYSGKNISALKFVNIVLVLTPFL